MEELSIQEKAQLYDKVLKQIKECTPDENGFVTIYPNEIFPELKEPEDERIRKEVISALKNANVKGVYDKHLAWLEKQGEKKSTQEIDPTPIFRIGDILKRKGKDYTFRVDRIQGGYYHSDRNHGAYFPIEQQDEWELVEQKPTWSEDDIMRIDNLIAIIENRGYPDYVEYLEKLKDRVQPKPKQGWSEEDKNMLQSILDEYKSMPTEKRNWLKSLKPQNRWKPSNQQICAVDYVIKEYESTNISLYKEAVKQLISLREQLKAL